ncbi:hypothetical protein OGAPHI_001097 [Ogataea philodendri]|uniref:Uncharacterized protein n=1 Tax=Ogataea philodendri TaxID=1378263 RepID=A0A9P8PEW5_9ASCO|nr:uncharacterized protein OGAPHI_001097 [Ogataea philodendri]KAH3670582.1 hypothetical protein OGAPHI_001097 [Ogataea philodendri]
MRSSTSAYLPVGLTGLGQRRGSSMNMLNVDPTGRAETSLSPASFSNVLPASDEIEGCNTEANDHRD